METTKPVVIENIVYDYRNYFFGSLWIFRTVKILVQEIKNWCLNQIQLYKRNFFDQDLDEINRGIFSEIHDFECREESFLIALSRTFRAIRILAHGRN